MNDHQSQRLLDALSEPSRAALLEGFRVRRLVQGEILGGPQEIRDSVFILRSGRIRVFLTFEDKEQTLTFLEPGDIYSTHSRAYLQAIGECDVLVTETRTMLGKLAALPEAAPVVIRVLAQSLGNAMQIIEDLAFRDVEGRLARFLDGMLLRKGELLEARSWRLPLALNTEDIAQLLGTTRQTLSSLIARLTREGILERDGGGTFLIHRADLLRERSGWRYSSWRAQETGRVSAG